MWGGHHWSVLRHGRDEEKMNEDEKVVDPWRFLEVLGPLSESRGGKCRGEGEEFRGGQCVLSSLRTKTRGQGKALTHGGKK